MSLDENVCALILRDSILGTVNVFKLYEKVHLLFPKSVFEIKLMMHIVNVNLGRVRLTLVTREIVQLFYKNPATIINDSSNSSWYTLQILTPYKNIAVTNMLVLQRNPKLLQNGKLFQLMNFNKIPLLHNKRCFQSKFA